MGRPVHFEILGDDPAKLAEFYSNVLGWEFQSWSGSEEFQQEYWLAATGPKEQAGIDGAIMKRHFPQPVINTTLVDSLDETLAKVAGGRRQARLRSERDPLRRHPRLLRGPAG